MKQPYFAALLAATLVAASCQHSDVDTDASGVFEATEVVVSAKAQGEILDLNLAEGDTVVRDAVVGRIDTVQLSLMRQQLLASQKANDDRTLSLPAQVASLRQQIDNNKREKARYEQLVRENAATQKQVDDIGYQISVLERQLQATAEQIASSNTSIASQGQSIQNQIAGVEQQIGDAIIRSTISGTVLTKYAEAGEYAVPGKALFRVADISKMWLRAYVTAPQATQLKIGQAATVYADDGKNGRKAFEGTVSWISSEAEFTPKTIQTRDERANLVYAVKIAVKNDGTIKRGMYGDVKF